MTMFIVDANDVCVGLFGSWALQIICTMYRDILQILVNRFLHKIDDTPLFLSFYANDDEAW